MPALAVSGACKPAAKLGSIRSASHRVCTAGKAGKTGEGIVAACLAGWLHNKLDLALPALAGAFLLEPERPPFAIAHDSACGLRIAAQAAILQKEVLQTPIAASEKKPPPAVFVCFPRRNLRIVHRVASQRSSKLFVASEEVLEGRREI